MKIILDVDLCKPWSVGVNDSDHEKIIYKSILSLGMVCEECVDMQFAVADEYGVQLILG